ncbi:MAG: hypothetical protein NW206_06125 [Hyphomonadaceae bacterium]|nr:hypothetical protein [Hyphomonadaceae bacterium]
MRLLIAIIICFGASFWIQHNYPDNPADAANMAMVAGLLNIAGWFCVVALVLAIFRKKKPAPPVPPA